MCKAKIFLVLFLCVFLAFSFSSSFGQSVSSPKEVLGFEVGADYHLATYTQAIAYFKVLEQSSERIRLFDVGKTSVGQTMTYAVISTPENLKNLDDYKGIARKITSAKGLSKEAAKKHDRRGSVRKR